MDSTIETWVLYDVTKRNFLHSHKPGASVGTVGKINEAKHYTMPAQKQFLKADLEQLPMFAAYPTYFFYLDSETNDFALLEDRLLTSPV